MKKANAKKKATGKKKIYMVRSYGAGVFFGEIVSRKAEANGVNVEMKNARRVWFWKGAATLSQLAVDGTSVPTECKFPCVVASQKINNVIEEIEMTDKAVASLNGVPVWKH
jgi:hypothetical protein